MVRFEDITRGAVLKGVVAGETVTVVDVKWFGAAAIELTYKLADGSGRRWRKAEAATFVIWFAFSILRAAACRRRLNRSS